MKFENFGLLGQQLLNAVQFWRKKFDLDLRFIDPVTQDRATSGMLFKINGKKWVMRSESLPGQIGIKALGVDDINLYVETSQIVDADMADLLLNNQLDFRFDPVKRIFMSKSNESFSVKLSTRERHQRRCLWSIPLSGIPESDIDQAVSLVDMVSIENAFENGESEGLSSSASPATMMLRLDTSIVQVLENEQVPELLIGVETALHIEQSMQITQLLQLQFAIMRMSGDELVAFVQRDTSEEGQKKALKVLHFVVTGKIKKAKKELSWKDARSLAWKLIRKPVAS